MGFNIKLQFGDNTCQWYNKEYTVQSFQNHYSRTHNHNHPDSVPRCESITLTLKAPVKEDLMLYEWFVDQSYMSGRIYCEIFSAKDMDGSEPYIICFDDAQVYELSENFDFQSDSLRLITLQIDAMKVTSNDVAFEHL